MIDADLQARAQKLEPRAVEAVLNAFYPVVYRMAVALTGRESAGQRVVRAIMRQAIARMSRWENEGDPQRWFHHHTVLASRRAAGSEPAAPADALVRSAGASSPQYVAFIRAVRRLATQQREAVILRDGEQLDARAMAVAMDCSTEAASNHLAVGRRELLAAAGGELNQMLAAMREAYQRLTPDQAMALPLVKRAVRRQVWPRRIGRVMRVALLLGLLAVLIWFVWVYGRILDW